MAFHTSFTAFANSLLSNLGLVPLHAVRPNCSHINISSRNLAMVSRSFFGSTSRWTGKSCRSSRSTCEALQHTRAAANEVSQLENHDQIPPLSTILQYLSPTLGPSRYSEEASSIVTNLASGWGFTPNANKLMNAFKPTVLTIVMDIYPRATSAERLAALGCISWLMYFLDELCFDLPASNLAVIAEEFDINTAVRYDISRMKCFWARLTNLFTSAESPSESVPIETAFRDAGRLMRSVSPPKSWLDDCVEHVHDFVSSSCELYFYGRSKLRSHEELEAYIELRITNAGMGFLCHGIEMVTENYMSAETRNHPLVRTLTRLCSRYCTLQNELTSYHKEVSVDEANLSNGIQVTMETLNMPFEQAVRRVMDTMMADSQEFLEIEQDPQIVELSSVEDGLRGYILGLKDIMSGFYRHNSSARYISVDNPFPELRPTIGVA